MFEGTLNKMITEKSDPINYFLKMDTGFIHMNQLIGKKINISYTGSRCLNCHKDIILFRQGFCKTCFFKIPSAGDWIMRPELSKAHLGVEDRDLEYEKKIQLQPHIIYLALSSHLKVGITRKSQLPTRWIDQGAHEAITLLEVPNRSNFFRKKLTCKIESTFKKESRGKGFKNCNSYFKIKSIIING